MRKPILCLDFDGVIHSYVSGWKGATNIPDPPVAGAMRFLWDATDQFRVAIFSSRSNHWGGRRAMRAWLTRNFREHWAADRTQADDKLAEIEWPRAKPAAMVTIDDRALSFDGNWPNVRALLTFKTWQQPGHAYGMLDEHEDPRPRPLPVRKSEANLLADLDAGLDRLARDPRPQR